MTIGVANAGTWLGYDRLEQWGRGADVTMIEPLLIVGIVIACTVWYMRYRWRRRARNLAAMRHSTGLEILARRYARGEIDRDEYMEKRGDILGYPVVPQSRP